ncbi:MAG: nickel-dependent lactate racemase [Clostridia bacterium]|nr:nickel-dependent lactate racemase [Clostridia bacterium]
MAHFLLPFGRLGMNTTIEDERLNAVLESNIDRYIPKTAPKDIIKSSLSSPIGTSRLSYLSKGKKNAVIILSDHTRPVPSRLIIPGMLDKMRKGNPDIDITLLVATGCHRGTSKEELISKLGPDIVRNEKIVIHDCDDEKNLISIGTLPSGGELKVNRIAFETELLTAEGFIEPHFFAGFSGGRKSVLPGIAARKTVMGNHCGKFIKDIHSRTGILEGNLIHNDMIYAAEKLKLAFIVNVVLNSKKEPVACFSGDFRKAHKAGTDFLMEKCSVSCSKADITVTTNGGYPLDQNIYQAVKGMTAAEAVTNDGGVIIMLAECSDGTGGMSFYNALKNGSSPEALMKEAEDTPQDNTVEDQWQYQILARIMSHFTVIMVSDLKNKTYIENMKMSFAASADEALKLAYNLKGSHAKVNIIPEGVSVIAKGV